MRFKLTPTLAPNVYNDCSMRKGGGRFRLLSNVLDTKGEGVSPCGDFFGFSGTKTRCLVGYKVHV